MNAVEISNVTVSFRGRRALSNLNLSVRKGSFVSLIGPNGAGKTTLLKLINGLAGKTSGRISVLGKNLDFKNGRSVRKNIGYIAQESVYDPRTPVSVYEAVAIGRTGRRGFFRRLNGEDRRAVMDALESVGLSQLRNRPVGRLSGGERQKAAIARALAQQPDIMLMDEPTSSLDLKSRKEVVNIIDRIYREKKITVIYVTHLLEHIPPSCGYTVMLKKGRIIWSGEHRGTYSPRLIGRLYGISESCFGNEPVSSTAEIEYV